MKISIIGAGNVGRALGSGLAEHGHTITYGVPDPTRAKYATPPHPGARVARVADAVAAGEVVILATPWPATRDALEAAGDFDGKPLLDATNPIGPGMALVIGTDDSGGEQVARWARGARVVKAFNSIGADNMARPDFGDHRALMPVAGDDEAACAIAVSLADALGFEGLRVGGLSKARTLEPLALLWIQLAIGLGERKIAWGLLRG